MIVRTYGSCRKNIDNFVILTLQRKIGQGIYILSYLLNVSMKSLHSFFVGKVIYSSFHLYIMFTGLYVMCRGNLSLHTFFNIFEFVRILVGFNRINCIVTLMKDHIRLIID